MAGIACGEKLARVRIVELKSLAENYGIPLDPQNTEKGLGSK
jgi:hypothetical protein